MPRTVTIEAQDAALRGDLDLAADVKGIVLFAHGSGSSRHSPRNRFVAEVLRNAGLGTLLMDLLTQAEEREDATSRRHRFDIDLLASRLTDAVDWLAAHPATSPLAIGTFGASTGAAAALIAAAERPALVKAVVSRGGRPDLAGEALPQVAAPTLLVVGGDDEVVLDLNSLAFARLRCEKRLEIVAGASHLFEEPGTLARAAELAADWFARHLPRATAS
jgi:dienelactone hydrolase